MKEAIISIVVFIIFAGICFSIAAYAGNMSIDNWHISIKKPWTFTFCLVGLFCMMASFCAMIIEDQIIK